MKFREVDRSRWIGPAVRWRIMWREARLLRLSIMAAIWDGSASFFILKRAMCSIMVSDMAVGLGVGVIREEREGKKRVRLCCKEMRNKSTTLLVMYIQI